MNDFQFIKLEGAAKEQAEKSLRDAVFGGKISETEDSTDLVLTKEEFMERMEQEPDGIALMSLLESGESHVVERMGLCHGYDKDGQVFFDVPGWNNLVSHLRLVNSV